MVKHAFGALVVAACLAISACGSAESATTTGSSETPLAASVFTAEEVAAVFPGDEWSLLVDPEAGDGFPPNEICGIEVPSLPARISVSGEPDDRDMRISQEILLAPNQQWIDALRGLAACDDVAGQLGIDAFILIPITMDGVDDVVAIQSLDASEELPHSIVVATLTASHTMLVSVDYLSEDMIDLDSLTSLVEAATARAA